MPQQDAGAREVQHPQEVVDVVFPAGDETAEVMEPGEEPLDLPSTFVAAQRSAVLRSGLFAVPPVRGNHLHVKLRQFHVQRIGVVGAVANEALGQLSDKSGVESGSDETTLVRRSRGGA